MGGKSQVSYVFDGGNPAPGRADLVHRTAQGTHTQFGDRASFSNESSPNSQLIKRNLLYRNVRNFNNLYDE